MSIPLDRLYHYIESIARDVRKDNVVIYRFWPYGSKNIEDLQQLIAYTGEEEISLPHIICYDQEPLNYELYNAQGSLPKVVLDNLPEKLRPIYEQIEFDKLNLRNYPTNIYDHAIIIHSELRSNDVEKYRNNGFIPVYYWFHGLISLDWYRYARHVKQNKNISNKFLIYNRAWSGTREYRLKFSELLIQAGLDKHCKTFCNPNDSSINQHYSSYQFNNSNWKPSMDIESFLPETCAPSNSSGDFDQSDYESTDIEVVLETLFDDNRLHLTEKSLRPIALGQPFILAATQGSLEYLRSYGFKTYSDIWNEDYDLELDPTRRLVKIVNLLRTIADWTPEERATKMFKAQAIADYNKKHFFSDQYRDQILTEITSNLTTALVEIETKNTGKLFLDRRKKVLQNKEYKKYSLENKSKDQNNRCNFAQWLRAAHRYKLRSLSN